MHYRQMKRQKALAMKQNAGNFDVICSRLSKEAERELYWWINNCGTSSYLLITEKPAVEIQTDASTSGGWRAVCNSKKSR